MIFNMEVLWSFQFFIHRGVEERTQGDVFVNIENILVVLISKWSEEKLLLLGSKILLAGFWVLHKPGSGIKKF